MNELGISIINSLAREICYINFKNLKLSSMNSQKNKKFSIKTQQIQIDNQLVRQDDAIILKREGHDNSRGNMINMSKFLSLKFHYIKNEAIENLYHFKYFIVELVPFDLNLDGNFCDEIYKYIMDIFKSAKRQIQMEHQSIKLD